MWVTTDEAYAEACDEEYMYMDYVSYASSDSSCSLLMLNTSRLQKNIVKVTSPGKFIYIDDGEQRHGTVIRYYRPLTIDRLLLPLLRNPHPQGPIHRR